MTDTSTSTPTGDGQLRDSRVININRHDMVVGTPGAENGRSVFIQ